MVIIIRVAFGASTKIYNIENLLTAPLEIFQVFSNLYLTQPNLRYANNFTKINLMIFFTK